MNADRDAASGTRSPPSVCIILQSQSVDVSLIVEQLSLVINKWCKTGSQSCLGTAIFTSHVYLVRLVRIPGQGEE